MKSNISQARISQEIRTMQKQNLPYLKAEPLDDDIYTWHFTFQGPQNTDFHQGLYHGQIILPFQYPFKPPDILFMNKNGRFQVNTKICLTITQYHPQEWNSAWTIRTMLQAVISLFIENVQGIGYEESSSQSRRFMAKNSHNYTCEKCGVLKNILKPRQQPASQIIVNQQLKLQKQQQIKIETGEYKYTPQSFRKKSQENLQTQNKNRHTRQLKKKQQNEKFQKNIKKFDQFQGNERQKIDKKQKEDQSRGSVNNLKKEEIDKNKKQQWTKRQLYYNICKPKHDIFGLNNRIMKNRQISKAILQKGKWVSDNPLKANKM